MTAVRRTGRARVALVALLATLVGAVAVIASTAPAGADGNEAPRAPFAARAITGGGYHTCVIVASGDVKCWGRGTVGQLGLDRASNEGDEPGEMAALPRVDLGYGRTATALAAGLFHTCALLDNHTVKCWGTGGGGRLGQDSTERWGDEPGEMAALRPITLGSGRTALAITAGTRHTCALLDNGRVKCWGAGRQGQLGQDSSLDIGNSPGEMAALRPIDLGAGHTALAVTAGAFHTCALLEDHTVTCWGLNASGQLGQGRTGILGDEPGEMARIRPVNLGRDRTALAIAAGEHHTCAVLDNHTVKCWGANWAGQLGQGNDTNIGDAPGEMAALHPVDLGTGRTARSVTGGTAQTCALLDDRTIKCWGANHRGTLGQDSSTDLGDDPGEMSALPPVNLGPGRTALAVTAGVDHVCARLDDQALKCWGWNFNGQLGQDSADDIGNAPGDMEGLRPIDLGVGSTRS